MGVAEARPAPCAGDEGSDSAAAEARERLAADLRAVCARKGFEALIRWYDPVRGSVPPKMFIPLAEEIGLRDAKVLAERLRCAVAGAAFDTPGGPVTITVRVGVASYRAGDSVATLMARADAAMYVAKRAGRNRVRVEVSREEEVLRAPDLEG